MKTIRDILDNLERENHLQLMHAFDNGLADFFEYEPGLFIGVNITPSLYPKLTIDQERGKWCSGVIENETG